MESEKIDQDNVNNQNRSLAVVELVLAITKLTWTYMGLLPFHPGCLLSLFDFISFLLCLVTPSTTLPKHFMGMSYVLSPIWVLLLDPCALPFAQILTSISVAITSIEHSNKLTKAFYMAVMTFSWFAVFACYGTLISECQESISNHLRRDAIMILVLSLQLTIVCTVQVDSLLKAAKDALAQVKDLNFKNETLNTELKQLLDDKDNFILLFSHETRNPLNILLGNLTLLLDEASSLQIKNKLLRCKFCADLLLQHLNNILDTGKLASRGTLEVTPTPVKIYEYLKSTSSFMEMLVKKKSCLRSELVIPKRLPTNLKFDMQRLTQVILNLLTNAVKFTESGSVSMVVRYLKKESIEEADYYPTTAFGYELLNKQNSQEDDDSLLASVEEFCENPIGNNIPLREHFQREICSLDEKKKSSLLENVEKKGFLKIEINDTGCGMKDEDLKKLFQKFSQAHSEVAQRQIGSGLGLWITKTLCELMNGGIRVYSKPKVGTCFSAIIQADSLPLQVQLLSKSAMFTISSSTTTKLSLKSQKRVLIADDDPYNLEVHVQMMRGLGYNEIETVTDGQKLLNTFKLQPEKYFEVVLSDVSMPHMDGIQAALKIREFEAAQKRQHRVKIGFITGHSNLNDKSRCDKDPISAIFYLPKPITTSMLESFFDSRSAIHQIKNERQILLQKKKNYLLHEAPLIMCVDDDIFNLDCLSEMLESLGAKSVTATSGEQGLSLFRSIVFEEGKSLSFVLMDCRMGGMDGWTACHKMKEMLRVQKRLSDIRIVGLTGEDKERNMERFRWSGMDDLIQKPATREKLQKLLRI